MVYLFCPTVGSQIGPLLQYNLSIQLRPVKWAPVSHNNQLFTPSSSYAVSNSLFT